MSAIFRKGAVKSDAASSGSTTGKAGELTQIEDVDAESPSVWQEKHEYYSRYPNRWARIRDVIREPAAEAIGCMILILFGNGVDCQVVLSGNIGVASSQKGQYLSISFLWAVGAALGVWASAGISGGHCNPVITVALALFRGFPWKKVPGYIIGQIVGAFIGALLTYANYFHAIDIYEGGKGIRTTPGTASLFSTYALDYMPAAACFFDEFLGTFILVLIVFAVTDKRNGPPPPGMLPLVIFLLVLGLGAAFGMQTGYAINPARDLGPRIMTAIVGYGSAPFNYRSQYWLWCIVCAPFAGGLVGAFFYDALIFVGEESPLNRPNRAAREHHAKPVSSARPNPIAGVSPDTPRAHEPHEIV
ncbi:aquaporin [Vararia minispora EC-137]|uniref:Aquaporin n=1 Tax=Vararia minispora EC-137 TaxID=1314806 RepID=A0ACB8QHA9_9AGAM|nr:aquaporin [Vararia minispora EC-137]